MYPHYELMKARQDDLRRSAALYRLAAQTQAPAPRGPRREPMTTAPVRLLARIGAWRIRPVSPQS
jgi:hypothetical protein